MTASYYDALLPIRELSDDHAAALAGRDDIVFMHGCALSIGAIRHGRGVVVTGSSGARKTTLVARLLKRDEYSLTVLNDDWGAVSLSAGNSVSTGERMLHMKSSSVRALRPGFFARAPRDSYSPDLSEPDPSVRLLVRRGVTSGSWIA